MKTVKYIMLVLGQGQDIIAELETKDGDIMYVSEPQMVGFNPEKRQIHFLDFLPHAKSKTNVPIVKASLLTWYEPIDAIANAYKDSKLQLSLQKQGIVVPGNNIIVPK